MVEPQVRELFEQLASGEPPPTRVNIALARSRGRKRLRWRRAGRAGAPVLAAAAAAAVVLATGAAPGIPAQNGATPPASASPTAAPARAPGRLDPLVPYASFGWLPAGQSLVSGGTGRTQLYLTAGPSGRAIWSLTLYSAGRCQLSTAQKQLTCAQNANAGQTGGVIGPAPAVRGHRAFWVSGYLAWEYARGGWAWLAFPAHGRPTALKVAARIRYRATTRIVFPAQLTGVPNRWQVGSVYYLPDAGVLRASRYALTAGPAALSAGSGEFRMDVPFLIVDPANSRSSCPSYPGGRSTREVVGGYRVTVTHLPSVRGNAPEQHLCAANAGGLAVLLSVNGWHPARSAVNVFGHLRLLGTNPADWTTTPIAR
jgi:hypothetical protein